MPNSREIKYKGLPFPDNASNEETAAEKLLDQIILDSDIPFSEEKAEQELQLEIAGFLQTMRYRAMGGDHELEEVDFDQWKEQIRKEIIRDHQIDQILSTVIEREHISVSKEELEAAAIKLAEKEHTSLEMVQRFMGENYSLLEKDVLYKKAKEFIVGAAVSDAKES